jgi:hypothetical protein
MTTRLPFTQARLERAIRAADKTGKTAVLRPDGSIIFENTPAENSQATADRLENERPVVL